MKKTLALVLIFTLFGFGSVFAQAGSNSFFVGWGMNKAMGPEVFKDFWDVCFNNITIGGGKKMNDNLEVFGMFEYQTFNFDKSKGFSTLELGPVDRRSEVKIISLTGNLKYNMNVSAFETLSSYIYCGGGIMRLLPTSVNFRDNLDLNSVPAGRTDVLAFVDNDAWIATGSKELVGTGQVGFGLEMEQGDGTIFLDARYVIGFTKKMTAFFPVRIGYIFNIQ
ncbi:hypothetical protein ACFL5P_04290 [candidate division KSB1 bacterium]